MQTICVDFLTNKTMDYPRFDVWNLLYFVYVKFDDS